MEFISKIGSFLINTFNTIGQLLRLNKRLKELEERQGKNELVKECVNCGTKLRVTCTGTVVWTYRCFSCGTNYTFKTPDK